MKVAKASPAKSGTVTVTVPTAVGLFKATGKTLLVLKKAKTTKRLTLTVRNGKAAGKAQTAQGHLDRDHDLPGQHLLPGVRTQDHPVQVEVATNRPRQAGRSDAALGLGQKRPAQRSSSLLHPAGAT